MMLTGASLIPIVTVCFSLAGELSYPVPESYSIGIMICFAQIFGFLLVSVLFANNFSTGPLPQFYLLLQPPVWCRHMGLFSFNRHCFCLPC